MCAFAAALASLVLASASAEAPRDVRWIVGPAVVDLPGGRTRCVVPDGVALASGIAARSILEVVAHASDGSELAVLSPVVPSRTWFVVVAWREGPRSAPTPDDGAPREGGLVWLERPRADERTGRTTWALAGPGVGGPSVNRHVLLPAGEAAIEVTLVAPVEELAEARAQLERIVEGIAVTQGPAPAVRR
jgi:hypothetical protein